MIRLLRGAASVTLFAVFGVGALAAAPLMLLLGRPELGQPVIRALWRPMVRLFELSGLIGVEPDDFSGVRGSVIAANHPSLIDVMLVLTRIPRTLFVAKRGLRRNPFLFAFVRSTSLPDDERLPERAAPYLARGWNVLIFPEGTRTPLDGSPLPLRRGAAQVALRCGAPLRCVRIDFGERLLAKRQPVWQMHAKRVSVSVRDRGVLPPERLPGESVHVAAVRLTDEIRGAVF